MLASINSLSTIKTFWHCSINLSLGIYVFPSPEKLFKTYLIPLWILKSDCGSIPKLFAILSEVKKPIPDISSFNIYGFFETISIESGPNFL